MNTGNINQLRMVGLGLLIVLATFAVYSPSIGYDFVPLDDELFVSGNPVVSGGLTQHAISTAWKANIGGYWAPLLWMSFQADVTLFGAAPWGFHLTNVWLHALNAGLLFWLLQRWTKSKGWAVALALLWAVHPLRVESVAWVTERKDVLSGLFFLLCVAFYVEGKGKMGYWGAASALAAGMLVKPGALLPVPFLLPLLDLWPLRRFEWTWRGLARQTIGKWAYWAIGLLLGWAAWRANATQGVIHSNLPSLVERLMLVPVNYVVFLKHMVWPTVMPLLTSSPVASGWTTVFSLAVLTGVIGISFWGAKERSRCIFVGWAWFLGMLVPSIGLVWAGTSHGSGERFSYLPQIGLMILLYGLGEGWRNSVKWTVGILLLACLTGLTWRRLPHWRNYLSFGQWIMECDAGHGTACQLGGDALMFKGDWAGAEEAFVRGASLYDNNCVARLCRIQNWCGQTEEAERIWGAFEEVSGQPLLESGPGMAEREQAMRWAIRGQILRARGDYVGALAALEEAVKLDTDPASFTVAEYLRTCHEAGRPEAGAAAAERLRAAKGIAIREWRDLLPRYLQFWQEGGRGLAFGYFDEYARRFPADGLALNNMAWLLATSVPDGLRHACMEEWPATALAWADRALAQGGEDMPGAWDTLAAARANAGDFAGAIAAVERGQEAAKRAGEWALEGNLQARLAEYRAGRPWREPDERTQAARKEPSR